MFFQEIIEVEENIVQQITEIEQESFGSGGMNPWFLVPFIRHGKVFVISEGDKILAVAEYMRDFSDMAHAYLFGFAVHREYRGLGIGAMLLEKSCRYLKAAGYKFVSLTVHPQNEIARYMYEKLGFVQTELRFSEYGTGEDRCVYELDLVRLKE